VSHAWVFQSRCKSASVCVPKIITKCTAGCFPAHELCVRCRSCLQLPSILVQDGIRGLDSSPALTLLCAIHFVVHLVFETFLTASIAEPWSRLALFCFYLQKPPPSFCSLSLEPDPASRVIFQVRRSSSPAVPGQGVFTVRVLHLSVVLPVPCVVWF
jgi:hypothetical protein